MKVGIMQPYFFPYLGYWQLINAVDKYVIYDDVNYIKRGWINRNRIIYQGRIRYINLFLKGASQNRLINEIEVGCASQNQKNLILLKEAYKDAPYFDVAYPLIEKIISQKEKNLSKYNGNLIRCLCDYLEIKTQILYSSEIKKDSNLKGQEKIMAICQILGASEYYNAIGGQGLYDYGYFSDHGIKLYFLKGDEVQYKQFGEDFFANLSIIDLMMFNSSKSIQEMLTKFVLLGSGNG